MSWSLLAAVGLLACAVLYASDQPGQRRRRKDPNYPGPERRTDSSGQVDFFQCPIFRLPPRARCDKLRHIKPEGLSLNRQSYKENNEHHI